MPSTVIQSFEYDASQKILQVHFQSGSVYQYMAVPPEVYEQMKEYREKGIFLNQYIKGKFAFRKIA
jgi:hypothetical protein